MAERADLERRLEESEENLAVMRQEQAEERDLLFTFGFLRGEWLKAIEAGTVDYGDLIGRLERALDKAKELRK